ncbi:zinc finger protein chinmo isoform X2 [Condylostylus longicornis]|uniref:zinc finger protein chinmo isoform X2 n=1 Tax=Condylostylus longicornis TaxID=2530218 RepID=UPI00244DD401|nr:zinc finger protein chinmo isoform X2 [Condylostylus longicornis]
MDPQQQFCLKWNSYSSNLAMTFSNLFKSDLLADVTLSCNGTVFTAHKLILAACSKKFADIFERAPTNGQCVVILEATSPENMAALLEFMYKGEVHVSQEALNSFLKSAENLQVKGLSTEHGRLAAAQSQSHESPIESPTNRRHNSRNSLSSQGGNEGSNISGIGGVGSGASGVSGNSGVGGVGGSLKQECDSLMHPSSSSLGGIPSYLPSIYRPLTYDPPRKRHFRSPFPEQETRGSVLRDGSKGSSESASPLNKSYRPSSSASSTAPTEADTMQSERASPQSSRYENHSPPTTTAGNGNSTTSCSDRIDRPERNNGTTKNEPIDDDKDDLESNDNGAEDLRVKMETAYSPQPPTSNTAPPTPTAIDYQKAVDAAIPGGLASIAPADMLNVWNAAKLNNKNSGMVNTADGKKLKCLYCDRLYGYETNLRAHIRQRHQGIRVPCPFCSRTFTRNNTVRRHIAREHKQEIGINQLQAGQNHAQ